MTPHFKRVISWFLSAIITLLFLFTGLAKLARVDQQVQAFAEWGYPDWSIYVVGVIEVMLALIIILPRTRSTGVKLIYIWTIGAVITHLQVDPPQFMAIIPDIIIVIIAFFIGRLSQGTNQGISEA